MRELLQQSELHPMFTYDSDSDQWNLVVSMDPARSAQSTQTKNSILNLDGLFGLIGYSHIFQLLPILMTPVP